MHSLNKISDRVYFVTPCDETDRPVIGIIKGDEKVLMVDSGNSKNHNSIILNLMGKDRIPVPDFCVLTHWHWDHVFGSSNMDAVLISHEETFDKLSVMKEWCWSDSALDDRVESGEEIEFCANAIKLEFPKREEIDIKLPDLTFKKSLTIDLGGLECEIVHVGGDHSRDSVVVYVPQEKILFLGDSVYENLYLKPERYTSEAMLTLLDKIMEFDTEIYVESHSLPKTAGEEIEKFKTLRKMAELSQEFDDTAEFLGFLRGGKLFEIDEEIEELASLFTKWKEI